MIKRIFSAGFSLLEVLVALIILSVVLFAIIQYQASALTHAYQNYLKAQALIQVESMLERLRANHSDGARLREYNDWNNENLALLPEGHGDYDCEGKANYCTVQVAWNSKGRQTLALGAIIQ